MASVIPGTRSYQERLNSYRNSANSASCAWASNRRQRQLIYGCLCCAFVVAIILTVVGFSDPKISGINCLSSEGTNCTYDPNRCNSENDRFYHTPCLCWDLDAPDAKYCAEENEPDSWGQAVAGLGIMAMVAVCCSCCLYSCCSNFVNAIPFEGQLQPDNNEYEFESQQMAYPHNPPPSAPPGLQNASEAQTIELPVASASATAAASPVATSIPIVTPDASDNNNNNSGKIPIAYAKPISN